MLLTIVIIISVTITSATIMSSCFGIRLRFCGSQAAMSLELQIAEIRLRSLAEALGNLPGLTPADRRCIVESFQRALRKLREVQALERQDPAENLVQSFYL